MGPTGWCGELRRQQQADYSPPHTAHDFHEFKVEQQWLLGSGWERRAME